MVQSKCQDHSAPMFLFYVFRVLIPDVNPVVHSMCDRVLQALSMSETSLFSSFTAL